MTPGVLAITFPRGDDYSLSLAFTEADGTTPLNIATWSPEAWRDDEIRNNRVPFTITRPDDFTLVLSFTDTETAAMSAKGAWKLRRTIAGATVTVLGGSAVTT